MRAFLAVMDALRAEPGGENNYLKRCIMKALSIFARSVALLAVLLIAAPQIAGAASPADEALQKAVSERLMTDKQFDATDVIVNAEDGVIKLRGQVKNSKDVQLMKNSAEAVPGVNRVDTMIDVVGPSQN